MKYLITGANGLLGQKLVKLLLEKGIEVVATGLGSDRTENTGDNYVYYKMDITDLADIESVVSKENPEVIINTAAMTNVDQCESDKEGCLLLNVEAVENLVKVSLAEDIFLVHLSTDFIFDGEDGPYDESAEANPISFYGQSKLDGENVIINSKVKWAILRTVLVYGIVPNMSRSNIILWVKGSLENNKNIKVVTDQWRTPTLAEDLAMGCYLVANKHSEGIFNISGKDMLTPYDMAMKTADYFHLDKSLISEADSSTFSQPAKRPPKTGFIIDKAVNELGYAPRSFDEGIAIVDAQIKKLMNKD